eukprot:1149267-Pelagomonas_calceolata.AAC.5
MTFGLLQVVFALVRVTASVSANCWFFPKCALVILSTDILLYFYDSTCISPDPPGRSASS